MGFISKPIGFIVSTRLTLLRGSLSSYQEGLLIFNTYFRWYLFCCYGWLWILDVLSPNILFYFIKATCNMQPRSLGWWIQFIVTAKSKGDTTKGNFSILLLPEHGFANVWWELWWGIAGGLLLMKTVGRGIQYWYISIINCSVQDLKIRVKWLRIIFEYVKCWNPL